MTPDEKLFVDDSMRLVVQVGKTTFRFTHYHLDKRIAKIEEDLARWKARRQFLIDKLSAKD